MSGEFHEQQEEQPKSDYEILGVEEGETDPKVLKSAWKKAVLRTHPDRNKNKDMAAAEKEFNDVNEAYGRLTKPKAAPIEGDPLDPAVQEAVEKRGKAKQYDAKYRENQDDPDADPSLWGED